MVITLVTRVDSVRSEERSVVVIERSSRSLVRLAIRSRFFSGNIVYRIPDV